MNTNYIVLRDEDTMVDFTGSRFLSLNELSLNDINKFIFNNKRYAKAVRKRYNRLNSDKSNIEEVSIDIKLKLKGG